jgi:hypothetical protein
MGLLRRLTACIVIPLCAHATALQAAGSSVIADVLTPFQVDVFMPDAGPLPSLGTVESQVVRTPSGTLDFYWRIHVDAQQPDGTSNWAVSRFNLQSFFSSAWDAGWRQDGPGRDVPWSFGASGTPGEATFTFIHEQPGCSPEICHGGIGSTFDSRFFFLRTDATRYAQTAMFSVDVGDLHGERLFGVSAHYPTFAPTPVPEPAAWGLMLVGVVALAARAALRTRSNPGSLPPAR